eukprot:4721881-Amphidinium_carterae.1
MQMNPKTTLVICNGTHTKNKLKNAWRAGLLPPAKITTRDLGVDTQWVSWRNPVQRKRIRTFEQSMNRVRGLGLPAHEPGLSNPSIVLASMERKLVVYPRKALGKGAGLRRSAPLELMAHGGPAADPQVSANLSTVRVWQWLLESRMWDNALKPGRGRDPTRNLKQLAVRLGWTPA